MESIRGSVETNMLECGSMTWQLVLEFLQYLEGSVKLGVFASCICDNFCIRRVPSGTSEVVEYRCFFSTIPHVAVY